MTFKDFAEKYKYTFPVASTDDFLLFDLKLKEDKSICKDLITVIETYVNTEKDVVTNLRPIIKKFISKQVLSSYTAQMESPGKKVFSTTTFFRCIEDIMLTLYAQKIVDGEIKKLKLIKKAMGSVINQSVDWEGGRQKRAVKRFKKNFLMK